MHNQLPPNKYTMEMQEDIEPTGWNENQERYESSMDNQDETHVNKVDVEHTNSGIAANADGNEIEVDVQNPNPEDINGGKGFLGDYTNPQHDDEAEEDLSSDDENHIMT